MQELNYHLGAIYTFLRVQLPNQIKSGRVDATEWKAMSEAYVWLTMNQFALEPNQKEGFERLLFWLQDDLNALQNFMREMLRADRTKDASANQELRSRIESLWAEYDQRAWLLKGEKIPEPSPTPCDLETTGLYGVAQDNKVYLQELADKVEQGRIVPFVGAGMTIPLGMLGWKDALNKIYSDARPNLTRLDADNYKIAIKQNDFEDAAQVLWDATGLGERWFNDRIKSLFGRFSLPPNITGAITLLPKVAHGPVLTTNFDAALERVYAAAGQIFAQDKTILGDYRAEESITSWHEGGRFLLKLHGDADESAGRVLTHRQYERAYGEGSKLPELLRTLFSSRRPLLFLGFSLLKDRTLTELERAGLLQSNAYHFAMLETRSADQARRRRHNDLIQRYGIKTIWFARGDFGAIERVLQCLADERRVRP